ncbi:lipopolysaccharide/colanic/teichoic acid biosynthesis glycosyltransferase [Saccharopolyspora erythraea NRRL 2338]|uniref:Undecaprenyl-phosphate galactosephosphotransferase n=2 Tax=Saccharopolyspora erythraea TaxID=1836 RepID=A4FGL3_SACEN|nr:sugar transferase [Saccharopolyspora erythraea]EQD83492.1 UDP-phosphate galactose phosphotransferase [Saccharopolyspora erythraea D]PFG96891.1 lipopolysaccharide/colanic/teichoic acid biosynthesis glycosyltransferase [Saccharopolyspora erythraea NRRL 2338]QRK87126.1 sugar transferase [Saccharopolyspora erythraea]CAM03188.1 undecaprenyl-phosphate galactosephosphotransferase [Saccharopolyspora erythraea NRRL 2338]
MSAPGLRSEHGGFTAALPSLTREHPCDARSTRVVKASALPVTDLVAVVVPAVLAQVPVPAGAAYGLAVLAVLAGQGQHRLRICLRVSDQAPRIAVAALLPVAVLLPWTAPGAAVLLALLTAGALVTARGAAYGLLRAAHRRGRLVEPALVVGSGDEAARIAGLLAEHPECGLRSAGWVAGGGFGAVRGLPALGGVADLAGVIARYRIARVLVCAPEGDDGALVAAVRACRSVGVDFCLVPRPGELGLAVPRACLDEIWGVVLVPLRRPNLLSAVAKRAFDLVVGTVLLVLLAPVLLVLAGIVRGCGKATTFFCQWRVSRTGRLVRVVKLRTLVDTGEKWAVAADQCTALGRWLRGTHLDELPQLVNVLRGEMSLVGPRPERPYYAKRFAGEIPHYADRHRMPGGMTGWAQVHGLHGDTSIPDRARFDNQYIEYWSLWMDLVVVARTVAIVARAMGGRR